MTQHNNDNNEFIAVDAEIIEETTTEAGDSEPSHSESSQDDTTDLKDRLLSADTWLRFVFMVLFAIILLVSAYVAAAVVILQFVLVLFKGEKNEKLRAFGQSLSQFVFQTLSFLTYNAEEKPFPFKDWPVDD